MLYPKQQQIVNMLVKRVDELKGMPYRAFIVHGKPGCGKTEIAKELARVCRLRYVDFLEEVLLPLGTGIETYNRHKLLDYIGQTIRENGATVFDEMEGLFATWGRSEQEAFFRSLYRFKIEFPAIIVTRRDFDFAKLLGHSNRVCNLG